MVDKIIIPDYAFEIYTVANFDYNYFLPDKSGDNLKYVAILIGG